MNRKYRLNRFQFDNNGIIYNHVGPETGIKGDTFVTNWNCHLKSNLKPSRSQFMCKHCFIHGFKQTRTKSFVDFDTAIYYFSSDTVFNHGFLCVSVCSVRGAFAFAVSIHLLVLWHVPFDLVVADAGRGRLDAADAGADRRQ